MVPVAPSPYQNYWFDAREVVASADEEACLVVVDGNEEAVIPWDNHTVDGQSELAVARDEKVLVEWEHQHPLAQLCEKQGDDTEHAVVVVVFHNQGDGLAVGGLQVVFGQMVEALVHHTFGEVEGSFASWCLDWLSCFR